MKRAKCYIELGVGDRDLSGRKEAGVGFIPRNEVRRESMEQLKYPLPDLQKQELLPSLHHYYSQTLPISKPLENLLPSHL